MQPKWTNWPRQLVKFDGACFTLKGALRKKSVSGPGLWSRLPPPAKPTSPLIRPSRSAANFDLAVFFLEFLGFNFALLSLFYL
jgi:hypothetical protein